MRHRIEHCEMITRQELARLKQLDILPSMQPNFIGEWGMPGGMYEDRFPATKVSQLNPLAWIVEEEIPFSAGSDCMPFEPVYGIHSAVNTPHPAQRISPKEALYAYTAGSAYSEHKEELKGSITPGKLADLVVLSGDPVANPGQIKNMDPEITILDGRIVYER
ncbi:MAG: amidohydrolase family protein, partial [Candidatus Acetothermia bacterium]